MAEVPLHHGIFVAVSLAAHRLAGAGAPENFVMRLLVLETLDALACVKQQFSVDPGWSQPR
ncbi:hypothetical protein J7E83_20500 [Arthrobacter sp. ISL-48]|uniref:hypothetical protein n=1 Tax=Arthrobacter sp. ISL-48 TaxID=2819110 RepID=UPI001BE96DA4|nr:hypothetical protein [Arthrobacter sp. ISL-48]MBT2534465.1 hypothetical protein [Arthrobacter sp. ISL-48]